MGTLRGLRRLSGFTIVELIVVIVVIGTLVGIVLFSYGAWQDSTRRAAVKNDLNAASATMESARNFATSYPLSIPSTFTPSENVSITLTLGTTSEYCIDGSSSQNTAITYYLYSKTKDQGPLEGTCATRPDVTPPAAPASISSLSVDSFTVTVSWASVADATSYVAQCASDAAFIYNPKQISVAAGVGVIQGTITGLTAGSSTYCRVKAINNKGTSPWSALAENGGTTEGLVAKWTFNGSASDVIGTAEGTVNGATLTTGQTGNANSAYSFNGTSTSITIPQNKFSNPMTVSSWFKATNATSGAGFIIYGNVTNGDGYGSNEEFHIGQSNSNYAAYINAGGCVSGTMTIGNIPDTGWHLITFVVGPGTSYATYIDGVPATSGNFGCTPSFTTYQATSLIGRPTSATRFLSGALDDVRIYNRALTPSEVLNVYSLNAE